MKTSPIYIALGANLPSAGRSPAQTLALALEALEARGIAVVARSSDWHSPAWPDPSAPAYVNAVAEIATDLSPRALLDLLHAVEAEFGRVRHIRWESRVLDLDLLDYRGGRFTDEAGLDVPHPRLADRAFVLLPLAEIAPHWCQPENPRPIAEMIAALPPEDLAATRKLHTGLR
ncbi:2-amino-4-hydroxy-6-hydroxymethyldihydropteridine diphosphokinase [Maricaulis salignorans]|uniref:2-amino-4-hydroxy-6-hydroxymethyldihydropteridine pyrophosphokinase n=1 Tax=Maricaulis salignorans TaxID=144026 RepID=A0A1G9PGS1_9PROT|nr:2-amino-4-hydroxy-6-hydroxymethyldihydropteridine diphosphokinase [Maricaulis salignorans]SDL97345.1 2-amino-4-hydroxy-6-hydroxymethyldihydropteridinediphosphokinase [Maricaulis salignorans]